MAPPVICSQIGRQRSVVRQLGNPRQKRKMLTGEYSNAWTPAAVWPSKRVPLLNGGARGAEGGVLLASGRAGPSAGLRLFGPRRRSVGPWPHVPGKAFGTE